MNINSIYFFDKEGYPINFEKRKTYEGLPYNYTEIYLQPISVSLFDCYSIFMLEKIGDNYVFPQIEKYDSDNYESLEVTWLDTKDEKNSKFFIYTIDKSDDNYPYINACENHIVNKDNYYKRNDNIANSAKIPFQINVAFSPTEETIYERDLIIYYKAGTSKYPLWKFHFYGEGIAEDDRFRVHLENFGIKFNRTDAYMLADYDIKEAVPDWELINESRKSLFVNKEEIFPYVGTYIGLKNIIGILGYTDLIDIKEYCENTNPNSIYNGKYMLYSIYDMMDDGVIDNLNVLDDNYSVADRTYMRKTGFLALTYEFTRATDELDEATECPIIEKTTTFSYNEMFYKLHKLKTYLEKNFLPVNVQIKDVVGEYTYYISFPKYCWVDRLEINRYNVSSEITVSAFPDKNYRYLQDLYRFYPIENEDRSINEYLEDENKYVDCPVNTLNTKKTTHYLPTIDEGVNLTDDTIDYYNSMITTFYTNTGDLRTFIKDYDVFPDDFSDSINVPLGKSNSKLYTTHKKVGCPIILSANIDEITVDSLKYMRIGDYIIYDNETDYDCILNSRVNTVKYLDMYEISWEIKYAGYNYDDRDGVRTNDFVYRYRSKLINAKDLPVFLPYEGYYDVNVSIYDLTGNISRKNSSKFLEIFTKKPNIVAGYLSTDVSDYSINGLSSISIEDMSTLTSFDTVVNVLKTDIESDGVNVSTSLINSAKIAAFYDDTELYNQETKSWEPIQNNYVKNASFYGFGNGNVLSISDYENATVDDLFHLRPADCVLSRSVLPTFTLYGLAAGDYLRIGYDDKYTDDELLENSKKTRGYAQILINLPSGMDYTAENIAAFLNRSLDYDFSDEENKVLGMFQFTVGTCRDKSIIGEEFEEGKIIYATAIAMNKSAFQYIDIYRNKKLYKREYSFDAPIHCGEYAKKLLSNAGLSSDENLLSCDIPITDILDGSAHKFSYMIDNGYFKNYNEDSDNKYGSYYDLSSGVGNYTIEESDNRTGVLPMLYVENYLNMSKCKFSNSAFRIPKFKYVIFFVDNIQRQVEYKWILKDSTTDEVLMITRNNPYFIWRFEKEGQYSIYYYALDALNNDYSNENFGMINVYDKNTFIEYNEYELSKRKSK